MTIDDYFFIRKKNHIVHIGVSEDSSGCKTFPFCILFSFNIRMSLLGILNKYLSVNYILYFYIFYIRRKGKESQSDDMICRVSRNIAHPITCSCREHFAILFFKIKFKNISFSF